MSDRLLVFIGWRRTPPSRLPPDRARRIFRERAGFDGVCLRLRPSDKDTDGDHAPAGSTQQLEQCGQQSSERSCRGGSLGVRALALRKQQGPRLHSPV